MNSNHIFLAGPSSVARALGPHGKNESLWPDHARPKSITLDQNSAPINTFFDFLIMILLDFLYNTDWYRTPNTVDESKIELFIERCSIFLLLQVFVIMYIQM